MKEFKNYCGHGFAYNTYVWGNDKLFPNSKVNKEDEDLKIIVTYNVEDISEGTLLYSFGINETEINGNLMFSEIEIDGVKVSIDDIDSAEGIYLFNKTGEHIVKYLPKNPEVVGIDLDKGYIGALFTGCESITNVKLPNTIKEIGLYSFEDCSNLTNINIPNTVTSIGEYAFDYCLNLVNIDIPNSVTSIGLGAFQECESIKSIVLPDSITLLGNEIFCYCRNLESITLPNNITEIPGAMFTECFKLNITIPSTVTEIAVLAFSQCTSFTSITIPSSVTVIGEGAFYECSNLISVIVESTTPPTLLGINLPFEENAEGRKIYVPAESVDTYKAASGWSQYANDIEAIPSN